MFVCVAAIIRFSTFHHIEIIMIIIMLHNDDSTRDHYNDKHNKDINIDFSL